MDVLAWADVAAASNWSYPQVERAVIVYHSSSSERLPRMKPSDVNAILAQVRQRLRKILFRQDITPPRELRDDVAAEILWRRRYASQLMEEALELWANTGEIASNDWPVIERLTGRPELRKMIEKFGKEVDQ